MAQQATTEFERIAENQTDGNLLAEFWHFLRQSKKWWLLPVVLVLMLLGVLILLSSTAAGPFIYTIF